MQTTLKLESIKSKLVKVIEMINDFHDAKIMNTELKNNLASVPLLFLGVISVPRTEDEVRNICDIVGLRLKENENVLDTAERVAEMYKSELLQG